MDGPTIVGEDRGRNQFMGSYERRVLTGIGHFIPREDPAAFVEAVRDLERARVATA